jgi:hypothetical protein
MSAPQWKPGDGWIVAFILGIVTGVFTWALRGSTIGAFCVGANSVFLMWAISDRLDAELERLRAKAAQR